MILPWNEPIPGASSLPLTLEGTWAATEHAPQGAGLIRAWTGRAVGQEPLVAAIVVEFGRRVGWTRSRFGPPPTTVGLSLRLVEPAASRRQVWGPTIDGHLSRVPTDLGPQPASIHLSLPVTSSSLQADIVLPSLTSTGILAPWLDMRLGDSVCRFGVVVLLKRDVTVFRKHIWRPRDYITGELAEVLRGLSAGWMVDDRPAPPP